MRRLTWILALVAMAFPTAGRLLAAAPDKNERYSQKEKADLTEILTAGLKVRTASEKAYIARVVDTVEKGQLSESVVTAMFKRARTKHERYPLPYFAAMMSRVAKQRGISL